MFCYLNFCCYFEANGQNHIHFQLIQVLKKSMAWYFLTITAPSSKLEFVYPPCCRVEEQMPFNAWTSQRLFKSNPQVNHRTHLKDCTPGVLNLVRPLTPLKKIYLTELLKNGTEHSRKKWHSALWLKAMHSSKKTSDELRICPTLYFSLRSWLCCCLLAALVLYQLHRNYNGTLLESLCFTTKRLWGINCLWWRPQSFGTISLSH